MTDKKGDHKRRRKKGLKKRDEERRIKRGARGGIKHQPGRGHERKSGAGKKASFKRKARRKWREAEEEAKRIWEWWDALRDDQRKLLSKLKPKMPRPRHEN